MLDALSRGKIRLLEHVVRIDAAQQPPVHPEADHPPQALAVLGKKRRQGLDVAAFQTIRQSAGIFDCIDHGKSLK